MTQTLNSMTEFSRDTVAGGGRQLCNLSLRNRIQDTQTAVSSDEVMMPVFLELERKPFRTWMMES